MKPLWAPFMKRAFTIVVIVESMVGGVEANRSSTLTSNIEQSTNRSTKLVIFLCHLRSKVMMECPRNNYSWTIKSEHLTGDSRIYYSNDTTIDGAWPRPFRPCLHSISKEKKVFMPGTKNASSLCLPVPLAQPPPPAICQLLRIILAATNQTAIVLPTCNARLVLTLVVLIQHRASCLPF